jgi:F420-0:gamma-glutamyl ligase-like protein
MQVLVVIFWIIGGIIAGKLKKVGKKQLRLLREGPVSEGRVDPEMVLGGA